MKHILLTMFLASSLLFGCKDSSAPVSDMPAIRSISFEGLPDENVTFDAANSVITVRMPAVLKGGLKPVMKLTDGAQPIGLLPDGTVDISAFCACSKPSQDVFFRISNQTKTATYRLNIVATGPLAPQDIYEETTFSLKTGVLKMSLPVRNLYDNHRIDQISFKGEDGKSGAWVYADGACLTGCRGEEPNRIAITLYSPIDRELKPGKYQIEMKGLKFPQKLIVVE
ncbi:hypothetical protein J2Y45_003814 [Dyadobacter sp. BE34]|uniref:Uncharacterized protein n=1 Tax=Dyadobacter fermentans TaxID=94254 RepID=A0ABU1QZN5_9BACT|nr:MULTISPECIES: hypothetical protein [Dyadobacter]MDR6806622.1 hypothetical protein [Dyadobacter fermentans]MDR7044364.1 hypothetical protein [Dyadobacter sp. BE242]MDR7198674.1 hypothetical protein [Dyadobacter sp. BE34]MDR7216636.1 hypothetical protein [Dyadobacter sp. BE31]MDR7263838.1 hypothetical protein [Dyadobacter sp. BE32]